MKKQSLFDDQAEDELGNIHVNEEYAQRFEHNKRREELHRLQEKHPEAAARLARKAALEAGKQSRVAAAAAAGNQLSSDDLSESSSEDDDDDLESEEDDTDKVLETLVRIKRHDAALYQNDTVIFSEQQHSDADADAAAAATDGVKGGSSKQSSKPVYLRTVLAQQALAAGDAAKAVDADDGDIPRAPVSASYASEQAALKAAFLAAAQEVEEDTAAAAGGSEEIGGLVKKKKAAAAAAQDGAADTKGPRNEQHVNKLLDEYFGPDDNSIDPADAFLKSYLANKGWKQPAAGASSGSKKRFREVDYDGGSSSGNDEDGAGDDEEDEEFLEEVDRFEAAYNFRYEEPGSAKVQSFPRVIADSVRRKDDRRKRARDAKAARVAEEKAVREAELRRMKNLKKEEIQHMLSRIQQEAGLRADGDDHVDDAAAAGGGGGGDDVNELLADLLEGDFDPEEYDRRMAAAFDDNYYQGSDDADELFGDGEEELADEQDVELPAAAQQQTGEDQADNDAAAAGFAALRQKQKQLGQADEAAQAAAAAAAAQRGQLQRLLEDYYKLDYEDMIGDIPCRFRYKQVDSENFGLSAEDILSLSDKQLNSVVGLKLLAPYRHGDKKLRPNYKALQELKGEAAGVLARRQRQAEKRKKKKTQPQHAGQQELQEQQPQVDDVQQQQRQGKQEQKQQPAKHKSGRQQKPHNRQQQQQQQKPAAAAAGVTAKDKHAARLASYAKLSLKPTKEQQQKRRHEDADVSSKHAKKKHKAADADGQQQPAGRLANVELAAPLTKAQKKNLLRSLKRKEKHMQQQ